VLVLVHPVACFHQGGSEETDIDDVPSNIADLNSVSYIVQSRKADGESAGYAGQHVLQGYGYTRAGDADGKSEAAQAIFKEDSEEKEARRVSAKDDELANFIARVGLTKTAGQRFFQQPKRAVNKEDADNGGNAFRDERKRSKVF